MGLINLSGHSLVEHCWPAGDMHIKYSQEYAAVTKYSRTPPLQTRAFPIYLKPSASPPPLKNDDCNDKLRAEFGAFQLTSVFGHGGGGAGGPSSWRSGGLTNSLSPGPCHLSPLDPHDGPHWFWEKEVVADCFSHQPGGDKEAGQGLEDSVHSTSLSCKT